MIDFQDKYNVFQSGLEIAEPLYVFHHELAKEEKTLHIYIEYRSGAEFSCPNCGTSGCKVHDIQDQNRTWRHLDFWQYRTQLNARMPHVKCESCGKIRTVIIDRFNLCARQKNNSDNSSLSDDFYHQSCCNDSSI